MSGLLLMRVASIFLGSTARGFTFSAELYGGLLIFVGWVLVDTQQVRANGGTEAKPLQHQAAHQLVLCRHYCCLQQGVHGRPPVPATGCQLCSHTCRLLGVHWQSTACVLSAGARASILPCQVHTT